MGELIFLAPSPVVALSAWILALVSSEIGLRIGRRRGALDADARATADAIQAALLALLGLLLAFTLSMSVARFEQRRTMMADEANAVGVVWLRAGLLPEPPRSRVRSMLTEYAKSRIVFFESPPGTKPPPSNGEDLRARLWDDVAAVAQAEPRSIPIGLLVQALNDMIDLHARRLVLHSGHVPEVVWWMLGTILLIATATVGYNGGRSPRSHVGIRLGLATALSFTLALALDLDRPTRGVIRIREEAMRDLVRSMGE